ncbi:uncharacterized protein AB675_5123 [Cyphellophora attinorum]|uniref:F-box domain-containing protein n=1 Tax=Cyphellophora attinorum TaxID=1664694 RepID=A0A0N1NXY3_9EURO|nr:uncharacterized protein AB675_5123 [Phialophora attinorum]KPI39236.1 hypothetical protein AB675_5123 [Phialophora attinorum]
MTATQLGELYDDLICTMAAILPPTDAISFSLCNKRLHSLSDARLRLHREYCVKYSVLYISNNPNPPPGVWAVHDPLTALYQLFLDPWRARYVRRVQYDRNYDADHGHEEPDDENDALFEFLGDPWYWSAFDPAFERKVARYWRRDIEISFIYNFGDPEEELSPHEEEQKCECGKCLIMLLTLLPNLGTLEVLGEPFWDKASNLFLHYVQEMQEGDDTTLPLAKLRTILYKDGISMVSILPWAALPSVRQLYVARLDEQYPDMATHVLEHYPPNLSILGIAESRIHPSLINAIIDECPSLQRLTFAVLEEDWVFGCGCSVEDFFPFGIGELEDEDDPDDSDASDDSIRSDGDEDAYDRLAAPHRAGLGQTSDSGSRISLGEGYPSAGEDGGFDHLVGRSDLASQLQARNFVIERFLTTDQTTDAYVYDFKKHTRHGICKWLSLPCASDYAPAEKAEICTRRLVEEDEEV